MKNVSFLPALLISMLTVWMFGACNSESKQSGDAADSTAMQAPVDSSSLGTTEMPEEGMDDHFGYSYDYAEDEVFDNTTTTTNADSKKASESKKTPPKLKVNSSPVVYTVTQTDRPPLFSAECMTAKNPQRCSNNALEDWAKKSVKYPAADLAEGSDGLEYVTFVINKNGKVSSINRVESKKEACEGCSKAVIDAVLAMPDWQPAMLGGNPVNVVVTLPVRFRAL